MLATNNATAFPASATITLSGGTLGVYQPVNQANLLVNPATFPVNFAGGATIRVQDGAFSDSTLGLTSLNRSGQGTVLLQGLNGRLGRTVYDNGEFITATNVLGTTAAAALNNGIVAPSILVADPNTGVAGFATYGTTGFAAYTGSLASSLSGGNANTLASVTTAQTLTGVNDVYAAATTANISGGTLRFLSAGNTNMGGLLLNAYGVSAPQVGSDLLFGNTLSPGQPAFGEGLVYVGAGATSGTATLSGAIAARNFTKSGEGTLRFTGNLANLTGNLAVNSGSVQFGGANAGPLAAQLSLNDLGTLDLAGSSIGVANLAGTQGVITGGGTLSLLGTQSTTYSGVIGDGATATRLVKKSGNTLTLSAQTPGSVMSGNNTFTGGVDLFNGTPGGPHVQPSKAAAAATVAAAGAAEAVQTAGHRRRAADWQP
jgi:autotransporter-associated beta strand protein